MAADKHAEKISSGIDELVEKLKNDGIQAGQQQALDIIAEAEKRADLIERQAQEKADAMLKESHERIEREEQAAKDALQLAFRDMVLGMKNAMLERLSSDFSREVKQQAAAVPVLEKMILEAVRQISAEVRVPELNNTDGSAGTEVEVLVPQQLMQLDDIRANPDKASDGPLADLSSHLAGQMFSQGIRFAAGDQDAGIQMKLQDGEMLVDVSDKAIADLLLKYLQPRFRAILEGVIH
ncbi:hypothetical protein [Bacterioplanoides sp.]|uniref:hypothetical protein n=1 Tax=Bacterioplanoides sp. TaxID=2066072 RepID=UPI003B5ACC3C